MPWPSGGIVPDSPQVASIAPIGNSVPVSGGTSGLGTDPIGAMLSQTAGQATQSLPPQFVQEKTAESIAQPRLPPQPTFTPMDTNRAPMNNQATSIRQARNQNAWASLANLVGHAGQVIANKKYGDLKADLTDIMQQKRNIANAEIVLQQDPNNQQAKDTIAKNKADMERILSNPKRQKALAKALNIDFTDPEANKTPEIKAYQDAKKEFDQSGIFNANNPQEAEMAAKAAQGQIAQPQATKSPTARADLALSRDMPTMQVNPAYTAALKQREDAQKQIMQYNLPRLITAMSNQKVAEFREGKADARAVFKVEHDQYLQQQKRIDALDLQDAKSKDALKLQARKDANAMMRLHVLRDSVESIAEDKRLDPATKAKAQAEGLKQIDADIKGMVSERQSLSTQLLAAQTEDEKKVLNTMLDNNEVKIKATNVYRQELATKTYGRVAGVLDAKSGAKSGTGSTTEIPGVDKSITGLGRYAQQIGTNISDENQDDDDTNQDDDNSDLLGINN